MRPSIEELLISDARGEPMAVDERSRLETALRGSAHLERASRSQHALTAQLADLREELRSLPPPQLQSEAMRWSFRAHRAGRAQRRGQVPRVAAVGGIVAAVAAVMLIAGGDWWSRAVDRRAANEERVAELAAQAPSTQSTQSTPSTQSPPSTASTPSAPSTTSAGRTGDAWSGVFQPVPYAPPPSPSETYSIVRVRIPLEALVVLQGGDLRGTVDAEILIGEDGLARGVRFASAERLLVSSNMERPGEER